jgi:hypothetical protein
MMETKRKTKQMLVMICLRATKLKTRGKELMIGILFLYYLIINESNACYFCKNLNNCICTKKKERKKLPNKNRE